MTTTIDFVYETASLTLAIWEDTHGSFIDVISVEKGKGHATGLMNSLTEFADLSGMRLTTQAEPDGDEPRLSDNQLIAFYEKFGFVRQNNDIHPFMERLPQ